MSDTLFIVAARAKYRFPTSAGPISAEDLWDLPLSAKGKANLDDVAKTLHRELKAADGDISFVKPAVQTTTDTSNKLEIVKYVIEVKMAERDTAAAASEKAALKQKLLAKLAEKKDAALDNMSEEQILEMIGKL